MQIVKADEQSKTMLSNISVFSQASNRKFLLRLMSYALFIDSYDLFWSSKTLKDISWESIMEITPSGVVVFFIALSFFLVSVVGFIHSSAEKFFKMLYDSLQTSPYEYGYIRIRELEDIATDQKSDFMMKMVASHKEKLEERKSTSQDALCCFVLIILDFAFGQMLGKETAMVIIWNSIKGLNFIGQTVAVGIAFGFTYSVFKIWLDWVARPHKEDDWIRFASVAKQKQDEIEKRERENWEKYGPFHRVKKEDKVTWYDFKVGLVSIAFDISLILGPGLYLAFLISKWNK